MATEYEKNKEHQKRLNEAQKMRVNIITSEELKDAQPAEIETPTDFKGKAINWWYHNKIPFFICFFVVVLLVTLLVGIFSEKTSYDVSFTVICEESFVGSSDIIKERLYPYADNFKNNSNDKHAKIDYEAFHIPENPFEVNMDIQFLQNEKAKMVGRLNSNNAYIFMLDEYNYKVLVEDYGMKFLDLTKISTSKQIDKDKFILKDSKLAKEMQMEGLVKDMFLCIIDFESYTEEAQKNKNIIAFKDREYGFFKNMIKVDE